MDENIPENFSDITELDQIEPWLKNKENWEKFKHKKVRDDVVNFIEDSIELGLKQINTENINLRKKISQRDETIKEKKLEIANLITKLSEVTEEIIQSDISNNISLEILEDIRPIIQEHYDGLRTKIVDHDVPQNGIEKVGLISIFGQHSKNTKPSDLNFQRSSNGMFDVFSGWNRNEISADSSRAMFYPNGISVALCDGTSQGGLSSRLTSRIFSTLFTQGIPLTDVFCNKFCKGNSELIIPFFQSFLRYENDGKVFPTSLLRNLPLQEKRNVWYEFLKHKEGATTAINAIFLSNGMLWTSSVGDSAMYHYRFSEGKFEQIYPTTTSDDGGTSAIGLNQFHEPSNPKVVFLEPGDVVFLTSDLLSETEYSKWQQKVIDIHKLPQANLQKSREIWDEIVSSTDESDDVSIVSVKFNGISLNLDEKNVSKHRQTLRVDGESYSLESGDYYRPNSELNDGIKIISLHVAASLDIFRTQYNRNWPDFVPSFSLFKHKDTYYMKMEHFDEKYIRLDKAIANATSGTEINTIRNSVMFLEESMDARMISYGDISPTNIFMEKSKGTLHLIDLNSLIWPGSAPTERKEKGHSGMFGKMKEYTNLPSPFSHKLPFRILDLTLYLLSTNEHSSSLYQSINEEYVLTEEQITECYWDSTKHQTIVRELSKKFPNGNPEEIMKLVSELHCVKILANYE